MLHPFDTSSPDPAQRPRWMALLARAPVALMEAGPQAQREQAAASTRVEFFTVARQSESLDEREALDGACA